MIKYILILLLVAGCQFTTTPAGKPAIALITDSNGSCAVGVTGAVQAQPSAGGGLLVNPGMKGGLNG
jgi:hypothetical protein